MIAHKNWYFGKTFIKIIFCILKIDSFAETFTNKKPKKMQIDQITTLFVCKFVLWAIMKFLYFHILNENTILDNPNLWSKQDNFQSNFCDKCGIIRGNALLNSGIVNFGYLAVSKFFSWMESGFIGF